MDKIHQEKEAKFDIEQLWELLTTTQLFSKLFDCGYSKQWQLFDLPVKFVFDPRFPRLDKLDASLKSTDPLST